MVKHIVHHGNSRAVILDRALLRVVGIDPEGEVSVKIVDDAIVIKPAIPDPNRIEKAKVAKLEKEILARLNR